MSWTCVRRCSTWPARIAGRGWTNVEAVEADALAFAPPDGPADVVTFSYSLCMIPDWFAALDQAIEILRPGGQLGATDFYVSRKHPPEGCVRHPWRTRTFWPIWFGLDNVWPSPDHLPNLLQRLDRVHLTEARVPVPWVPCVRPPYYVFVGRKPAD